MFALHVHLHQLFEKHVELECCTGWLRMYIVAINLCIFQAECLLLMNTLYYFAYKYKNGFMVVEK